MHVERQQRRAVFLREDGGVVGRFDLRKTFGIKDDKTIQRNDGDYWFAFHLKAQG
jgi:hypothetical protein